MELDKVIRNILKTGKIAFGVNSALGNIKSGKAKLVILASNCPINKQEVIEYNCQTSNIPLIISDNSWSNKVYFASPNFHPPERMIKLPAADGFFTYKFYYIYIYIYH